MRKSKYTYEVCLEIAKGCKTKGEMKSKSGTAYQVARQNGWLKDYDWFVNGHELEGQRRTKYTYEVCLEIAKGCKTKREMQMKNERAYQVAWQNGWLKGYDWFVDGLKLAGQKKTKYTYEACLEIAKGCKTKGEMQKKNKSAYIAALKNGWLDDYDWFVNGHELEGQRRTKYTYEVCLEIAKGCKTKGEMQMKNGRAYQVAWQNGWLDDYDWFVNGHKKQIKWTKPKCKEAALKCKTLKEFRTKYAQAYSVSLKYDWLACYTWLKTESSKWNVSIYAYIFQTLKAVYIGLTNNTDRRDLEHHGSQKTTAVYKFAQKHNLEVPDMMILKSDLPADPEGRYWEDYYVKKYKADGWNVLNVAQTGPHASLGRMNGKLTKKKCFELSLDCTTRGEFRKKYNSAYNKSSKNGWLDEWEHLALPKIKVGETVWTTDLIWENVYNYNDYVNFKRMSNNVYQAAYRKGMLPEIKAYYENKKRA